MLHRQIQGEPPPDVDGRFSSQDSHRFKLGSQHLRMRGYTLSVEWTASGNQRFLIGHRGWFKHVDTLDAVFDFLRVARLTMDQLHIKNLPRPGRSGH